MRPSTQLSFSIASLSMGIALLVVAATAPLPNLRGGNPSLDKVDGGGGSVCEEADCPIPDVYCYYCSQEFPPSNDICNPIEPPVSPGYVSINYDQCGSYLRGWCFTVNDCDTGEVIGNCQEVEVCVKQASQ